MRQPSVESKARSAHKRTHKSHIKWTVDFEFNIKMLFSLFPVISPHYFVVIEARPLIPFAIRSINRSAEEHAPCYEYIFPMATTIKNEMRNSIFTYGSSNACARRTRSSGHLKKDSTIFANESDSIRFRCKCAIRWFGSMLSPLSDGAR